MTSRVLLHKSFCDCSTLPNDLVPDHFASAVVPEWRQCSQATSSRYNTSFLFKLASLHVWPISITAPRKKNYIPFLP